VRKNDVFHVYRERQNHALTQYVIKPGDTLYKIAGQFGVSVDDLINANALTSSLIYPNQIIVIPHKGQFGAVYFEEYVIQANETLESIAESVGITVDEIVRYNDITKLILAENQTLNIPHVYNRYTVQPGDTLESILVNTNMSAMELLAANKDIWLAPGVTINIF
jgi:LysM repeat protein